MTDGGRLVFGFGLIVVVACLAWRMALARWKRRHDARVARYVRTRGTVTDNRVDGSGSDTDYYQVVTYEVGGTPYIYVHDSRAYRPWPVGEPFDVAYDPKQPSTAVEADFDDAWDKKLIVAFAIGGMLITWAGWVD